MNVALSLFFPEALAGEARRATRVLLVEDDPDQRDVVADLLRLEGFDVATAENGLEALRHLRSVRELPDVVLLDLDMPVMDGREFRARQLDDASARSVPVVVLSSESPAGLDVAAALEKPCSPDRLIGALRAVGG
jgi:two-component system response regulator MprA